MPAAGATAAPQTVAVVLSGTRGGVGTTSLTVVLTLALSEQRMRTTVSDHTGGELAARHPAAAQPPAQPPTSPWHVHLHDRGPHALAGPEDGLAVIAAPTRARTIVVTGTDPSDVRMALAALEADRSVAALVTVSTSRRQAADRAATALAAHSPRVPVLTLPYDAALASPDVIDVTTPTPVTRQLGRSLLGVILR